MRNSKKVIRQHDGIDGGIACLATVANHFGHKELLDQLKGLAKAGSVSCEANSLAALGEEVGFDAETFSGSPNDLLVAIGDKHVALPLIAFLRNERGEVRPVVVFSLNLNTALVGDPSMGTYRIGTEDFFIDWTGDALILHPVMMRQDRRAYRPLRGFSNLLRSQLQRVAVAPIVSLAISCIGMGGALIFC